MLYRSFAIGCLIAFAASHAVAQPTAPESPQFRKRFELGQRVARDLEKRDGKISDTAILSYAQRMADQLRASVNSPPLQIHITRGTESYASLLPNGSLYISGQLF